MSSKILNLASGRSTKFLTRRFFASQAAPTTAQLYPCPDQVFKQLNMKDVRAEHKASLENPEAFWSKQASQLYWEKPFDKVYAPNGPSHQWFVGGKTNICYNALDRHADGPNRTRLALIFVSEDGKETKVTYGELREMVSRFAAGLKNVGVQKGDKVVLYMPLSLEGVVSMLACAHIGAVHAVVYAGLGVAAVRERIIDSGAKFVITGDVVYRRGKTVDLTSIIDQATEDVPLKKIIRFSRHSHPAALTPRDVDWYELYKANKKGAPIEWMDSEDPLYILHTSGSTGKPKGVMHVQGWSVPTSYYMRSFYDAKPGDVWWSTSDIGWIVGHGYIVYGPLMEGVTTFIREGAPDWPTPGVWWDCIEKYGINLMFTAPTTLRMFMKLGPDCLKDKNLETLRLLALAGEPCNPEVYQWARKHIMDDGKRGQVMDNWWQTELGAPTIATPACVPVKPGAAGVAMPGVDAAIIDPAGKPLPPNTPGNLVLRQHTPAMMRTIWGDDKRYQKYFTEFPGNVYASGDQAVMDENGYITILGRLDDMMKIAGHRVGTAEVESALLTHPSVAEAAVFGIPDPVKGETAIAHVILKSEAAAKVKERGPEGMEMLIGTLIAHSRREMGALAVLSRIVIVDKLPKTRSGKILRRVLKAKELGQDPGDLTTIEE